MWLKRIPKLASVSNDGTVVRFIFFCSGISLLGVSLPL